MTENVIAVLAGGIRGEYGGIFQILLVIAAGEGAHQTFQSALLAGIALEHARMAESYEADPRGAAIEFRKHLGWYVKGLPSSADLRRRLHQVESLGEVEGIFGEYLEAMRRGDVFADGEQAAPAAAVA